MQINKVGVYVCNVNVTAFFFYLSLSVSFRLISETAGLILTSLLPAGS